MEYQLRRVFEVRALLCSEDFNSSGEGFLFWRLVRRAYFSHVKVE